MLGLNYAIRKLLSRPMIVVTHLFYRLASSSSSVKDLVNVVNRLKQLDFAMSSIYERNLGGYLGQCSMFFRQLSSMISELHLAIQTFGERRPGGSLVDVAGEVYETCEQSRVIGERIQCLANAVKSSGFPALNPGMFLLLQNVVL